MEAAGPAAQRRKRNMKSGRSADRRTRRDSSDTSTSPERRIELRHRSVRRETPEGTHVAGTSSSPHEQRTKNLDTPRARRGRSANADQSVIHHEEAGPSAPGDSGGPRRSARLRNSPLGGHTLSKKSPIAGTSQNASNDPNESANLLNDVSEVVEPTVGLATGVIGGGLMNQEDHNAPADPAPVVAGDDRAPPPVPVGYLPFPQQFQQIAAPPFYDPPFPMYMPPGGNFPFMHMGLQMHRPAVDAGMMNQQYAMLPQLMNFQPYIPWQNASVLIAAHPQLAGFGLGDQNPNLMHVPPPNLAASMRAALNEPPMVHAQPTTSSANAPHRRQSSIVVPPSTSRANHSILSDRSGVPEPQILDNLTSGDLWKKKAALRVLAEALLVANEEQPPGIPFKDIVAAVKDVLINDDSNEAITVGISCLTNLVEAFPRSHSVAADAIPHVIAVLSVNNMYAASSMEAALVPLRVLSKKYGRSVLSNGGLAASLRHVEFLTSVTQRNAYEVAANCSSYITRAEFAQVQEVIHHIVNGLTNADPKIANFARVLFARMISNFYNSNMESEEIIEIVGGSGKELLEKVPIVMRDVGSEFTTDFYRSVRILMSCSPTFSNDLRKRDFAKVLADLVDTSAPKRFSPNIVELRELVYICGELAPTLPDGGMFSIDRIIQDTSRKASSSKESTSKHMETLSQNVWSSMDSGESRELITMIFSTLVPPLISLYSSVTDRTAQFEVLRVILRMSVLYPSTNTDILEVLSQHPSTNANMMIIILRSALELPTDKHSLFLCVAAIQLLRTLLHKDTNGTLGRKLAYQGVLSFVEELQHAVEEKYVNVEQGPVTRNMQRMKSQGTRKRGSPDSGQPSTSRQRSSSPTAKRERESSGPRSLLHALLPNRNRPSGGSRVVSTTSSSSSSSRPKSNASEPPAHFRTRDLADEELSELFKWIAHECAALCRLIPNVDKRLEQYREIPREFADILGQFASSSSDDHPLSSMEWIDSGLYQALCNRFSNNDEFKAFTYFTSVMKIGSSEFPGLLATLTRAAADSVDMMEHYPVDLFELSRQTGQSFKGAQALRYFRSHQVNLTFRIKAGSNTPPNLPTLRTGQDTCKLDALLAMRIVYNWLEQRVSAQDVPWAMDQSDDDMWLTNELTLYLNDVPIDKNCILLQQLFSVAAPEATLDSILSTNHILHYTVQPMERARRVHKEHTPFRSVNSPTEPPIIHRLVDITGDHLPNIMSLSVIGRKDSREIAKNSAMSMLTVCAFMNKQYYNLQSPWPEKPLPDHKGKWLHAPWPEVVARPPVEKSVFICKKLNAKVKRQADDFMTAAMRKLPDWVLSVAKQIPFALEFETRRSIFNLRALDRERALSTWLAERDLPTEDSLATRVHKVTAEVDRAAFLESATKALRSILEKNFFAHSLDIKFSGEPGTGYGPTQEFYSILSRELRRVDLQLWYQMNVETDAETGLSLVASDQGLFPMPMLIYDAKKIQLYETLGRALAQSLMDNKRMDIVLSPIVMRWLQKGAQLSSPVDLASIDKSLYSSIQQLATCSDVELECICAPMMIPNISANVGLDVEETVTAENRREYIQTVCDVLLVKTRDPLMAIHRGFSSILNPTHLGYFLEDEFEEVFCGSSGAHADWWELEKILDALKFDFGYTRDSPAVRNLVRMLLEFSVNDRRRFLQFVTGSPRLPHGGFKALSPPLTIVNKTASSCGIPPDSELPTAVTCKNYVKLPAYSSYTVMKQRFEMALTSVYNFHYN